MFKVVKFLPLIVLLFSSCSEVVSQKITVAAERSEEYIPKLDGKSIAVITNHSGLVNDKHLVDHLIEQGVNIKAIFAPEHGFRGDRSDGAKIEDEKDPKTGIPVYSLYGKNKKPAAEKLEGIDLILFDIQDVGTRYYTYISTMSYAMEAAAESGIEFMVLDRPNPNAYFVDGPVLDTAYSSFIGLHAVPPVYGMTIGEYALMVKGEAWIKDAAKLDLEVITLENWTHDSLYQLPVPPSPNLPNMLSVYLYTSLCYLEASNASLGRGTDKPFQSIGYPGADFGDYIFTPKSIPGASKYPKYEGEKCRGVDLSSIDTQQYLNMKTIDWSYVWKLYDAMGEEAFYKSTSSFKKLSGSEDLMKALKAGMSIEEYKESYREDLEAFKILRQKYLLYP